jgi:hypothetical protein
MALHHHEQLDDNERNRGVYSTTLTKPIERAEHVPRLQFNEEEAGRFLGMVDGATDVFLFASGDDDKERRKRLFAEAKAESQPRPVVWCHRRGSVDRLHPWIEEQQGNGWGVFVSAQAMWADKCRLEELAYIRTVFAEMDIGEPLKPWPIEPSMIVETSPGRYHVYWLVLADDPITADDFHGTMMCLVEVYGSDTCSKDLARRLRLPGTWNLKPGRTPHLVKIIHQSGARYSRDELVAAFPVPARPRPTGSATRPTFNGCTPPGLERFVGKTGDGPIWSIRSDSYGDWLRVGMALHAETNGGSDGLALWDRWSAGSTKWVQGVCEAKWHSFGKRIGINGGTIYHMASERGWMPPIRPAPALAGDRWRQRRREEPQAAMQGPAPALEFDDQITVETSVTALVKGVLHPGDVAAIYGASGVGKTFCAIDLAYHVTPGRSWNGRRVRPAPVLYVGLEGVRGLRHRMAAYAQHMGSGGRMLARLTIHTPLDKSEVGKAGEATIIEQAKALGKAAGQPVGLIIIIDTLARAIAGDDENSAQDMAAFVGRMSTIARETGAAVLVIHHPGKDDARGMRGSTAIFGACDTVIKITANGDVREVAAEKIKDGMEGPVFSYRLKQVSLGTDEDGDEITTCIVEAVAPPDPKAQRPRPESPAGKALNELEQLIIAGVGMPARGHPRAPVGATLVTRAAWRDACRQRCLSDGTPENEKKAFQRAARSLSAANLIGDFGDAVWPIVKCSTGHHGGAKNVG